MASELNQEQNELRMMLANELPVLRAKMRMTQESLTKAVGISRQTYTALESKRRLMTWNVFILFYLFFERNEETMAIMQTMDDFVPRVQKLLGTNEAARMSTSKAIILEPQNQHGVKK